MNMQYCVSWELILYNFKHDHNAVEETKNTDCMQGEGAVDHSTITRWLKKFHSGYDNPDNQATPGRSKIIDSVVMLQTIEANLVNSIIIITSCHQHRYP